VLEYTQPYASLEQVLGKTLPPRVALGLRLDYTAGAKMDVYSLGASLYRAFAPAQVANPPALIDAMKKLDSLKAEDEKHPVDLKVWKEAISMIQAVWKVSNPNLSIVPSPIQPILERMLSRSPKDRPSAEEVHSAFSRLLASGI